MPPAPSYSPRTTLISAFGEFDLQNTGKISRHHLKNILINPSGTEQISENEADGLLIELDPGLIDNRGMVDYRQFVSNMFP